MKFVFIHIPRTGGSVITTALRPFADGDSFTCHATSDKKMDVINQADFSFAFVRNPFARQVSLYNYVLRDTQHALHKEVKELGSFHAYIENVMFRKVCSTNLQVDFIYSKSGELLLDFIGRYENIQEDFQEVCQRIGIEAELAFQHPKTYRKHYDDKSKQIVSEVFERDLTILGYDF